MESAKTEHREPSKQQQNIQIQFPPLSPIALFVYAKAKCERITADEANTKGANWHFTCRKYFRLSVHQSDAKVPIKWEKMRR